jgi:hypothetical protein
MDAAKLTGAVREVEANLSKRISRLEGEVADHSSHIHDLRSKSFEAEQSMGRLLSAVEGFCEQAANRLETVTAPALSAAAAAGVGRAPLENRSLPEALQPEAPQPAVPTTDEAPFPAASPKPPDVLPKDALPKPDALTKKLDRMPIPEAASKSDAVLKKEVAKPNTEAPSPVASMLTTAAASPLRAAAPVMTAAPFKERAPAIWWRSPIVILVGVGTVVILLGILLWPTGSSSGSNQVTSASEPAHNAPVTTPAPTQEPSVKAAPTPSPLPSAVASKPPAATSPAIAPGAMRVELVASEPSWVSVRAGDGTTLLSGLIEPGKSQSVDIRQSAVLRAGNAGGLTVRANGKSLGPLGPHGAVRDVEFKNGDFKLVPVK